jgi:UDP-N-acetylmuramoylalanine--D-glutamate ligase
VIFVSPGIPRTIPVLAEASRRGIPLSSETELFFSLCRAPIIGITASSGKTTTTTLVGRMLEAGGRRTWVGGNIGEPLLTCVDQIGPDHGVVLELSSFQLEHLRASPHIAGLLNITPNHLDRHSSMKEYTQAKWNIVAHQRASDAAIFGADDPGARQLAATYHAGRCALFSAVGPVERGAFLQGETIMLVADGNERQVCSTDEIHLRGQHNRLNVLAACALAAEVGILSGAMKEAIAGFTGVAHRLEPIRLRGGVLWVNDSIATTPERSMAALRSFDEPIILLAGGRDKHLPWDGWADLALARVRELILFGEAAGLIERAIMDGFRRAGDNSVRLHRGSVRHANDLAGAVATAEALAQSGDVVLLSPGGTSFDAFVDFAQRGERFRTLVESL